MNKIKRTLGFIFSHPMGERHPFKSLLRFFSWQFQCRFSPAKLIIKDFITPVRFYARKGLTGITGNIYTGLHEFNDMAFLLHFLCEKDRFIDIGANVGAYTLLASGTRQATTIAIEPAPLAFELLRRNIVLNELAGKVLLVNSVAGAKAGTVCFSKNEDTTNHVVTESRAGEHDSIEVPQLCIDSLLTDGAPALIKIDVEGYEHEVLNGMHQTLASAALKALIVEVNDSDDVHQRLTVAGFAPYWYDPFRRFLTPLKSYGPKNTIYCRDLDFVNRRVRQAPAFTVMGEKI